MPQRPHHSKSLVVILLALSSISMPVNAQAPRAMSFQGLLTDTAGVPVDGPQNLTIRIFDALSGGSEVWNRTYGSHPVNEGVFDVELDGGTPMFDLVAFNNSLWIQVEAGAEVLSPRTRLMAAPFAMGLSLPIEANVAATTSALKIVNTTASGVTTGVYGQASSTSGRGVYGQAVAGSGVTYGVYGYNLSESGRGVYGLAKSSVGVTYGVYGQTSSTSGRGVFGQATAVTGVTTGVYGETNSTLGRGVYGLAEATTGDTQGVWGLTNSTSGRGVYGLAEATTGITYGVFGRSVSHSGWGGYFTGGQGTYTRGYDNDAPDLVLGGSSTSSDDGRITSDPAYPNSDIWLQSNDAVVIVLDVDASGNDADFEIRDKDNVTIFNVDESGQVRVNNVIEHASDRNRKHNIVPVDPNEILEDVAQLPIHRWSYKGETVPHVGPMAQDFYASFEVGSDDKYIAGSDANGVALAAIQALYELVKELQSDNVRMRAVMERAGLE